MRGIGIDIVEVKRIRALARKDRFLSRIFSAEEVSYCRRHKDPFPHFAARFAAKEAVYKALGVAGLRHKEIIVQNARSGKPGIHLPKRLRRLESRLSVSLSHSDQYACAVADRKSVV